MTIKELQKRVYGFKKIGAGCYEYIVLYNKREYICKTTNMRAIDRVKEGDETHIDGLRQAYEYLYNQGKPNKEYKIY